MSINLGPTIANPVVLTPALEQLVLTANTHTVAGIDNNKIDVDVQVATMSLTALNSQVNDEVIAQATLETLVLSGISPVVAHTPIQGTVTIDAATGELSLLSNNPSVTGVTVGTPSGLEADWQARISQPGVVWYHDFRSDEEVDAFRWVGGTGNDPDDTGDDPNTVRRNISDGITGACLELFRPAGSNDPAVWWRPFSPMDTGSGKPVDDPAASGTIAVETWAPTQGGSQTANWDPGYYGHTSYHSSWPGQFDGTEYYFQVRVKMDPRRTAQDFSSAGKLFYFTRNDKSLTSQEIVTKSGKISAGVNWFSMYRSGGDPLENDTIPPSSANQPGSDLGFCDYPGQIANCWRWSFGWDTLLYHVRPGLDSNSDTILRVWAMHPGETAYTKIWDQDTVNLPFAVINGVGSLICSCYQNGQNFTTDVWHRYCQMIFSHDFIAAPQTAVPVVYPEQGDWVDQGNIITAVNGTWEKRLDGISPCTVVKKDGTYFLYYIGADGDRGDGGPAHRKLGVATSTDGLAWTKYSGNPIISWNPNGPSADEEGIFSAAAMLDGNEIVLFYGAMTGTGGSVSADVEVVTSTDGFSFGSSTTVIDHADNSVWGFGDELYPIAAFKHNGQWHIYYLGPNWDIGLATGPSKTNMTATQQVGSFEDIIGSSELIPLTDDTFGIVLNHNPSGDFQNYDYELYEFNKDTPEQFGTLITSQSFNNEGIATVFYDASADLFLLMTDQLTGPNAIRLRGEATALSTAANALSAGQSVNFTANTLQRVNDIQWQVETIYYDSVRKELQYMGKPASSQSQNYSHFIYSEADDEWSTSGTSLFTGSGHVWNTAFDPVNGDYYFRRYNENTMRIYDRSASAWTSTGGTTPALNAGNVNLAAMCYHPNLFGVGSPGIILWAVFRFFGWNINSQSWSVLTPSNFSSDSPYWNRSTGCGSYIAATDQVVMWAQNEGNGHPGVLVNAGAGNSSDAVSAGLITTTTTPPIEVWGGGGGTVHGHIVKHPSNANRLLLFDEHSSKRVWDSTDVGTTWNLKSYTHPFSDMANWSAGEYTVGTGPYGVVIGMTSNNGGGETVLWKPDD